MSFTHLKAVTPNRWAHRAPRTHAPARTHAPYHPRPAFHLRAALHPHPPVHAHVPVHPHAPAPARARPRETEYDWAAAGWAGIAAGAAFILIETTFVSLFTGDSSTDAIRQIAAIALGESALPEPTPFTGVVFLAAMGVHLLLSLIYARILAFFIHGMRPARAVAVGVGFGAMLYAVNYYAFTELFPWFEVSRGWITAFAHVAFGAIAAWFYAAMTAPRGRAPGGPIII